MNISINKGIRINDDNYTMDIDGKGLAMLHALALHSNTFPGQPDEARAFYGELTRKINEILAPDPIVSVKVIPIVESVINGTPAILHQLR